MVATLHFQYVWCWRTGEKKIKADEFLPIFSQIKKDKDAGTLEDFLECMKLYDKSDNGLMIGAELSHILLSLGILIWEENKWLGRWYNLRILPSTGERLEEKEVDDIIAACCDPEDEDGMIPYKRKSHPFDGSLLNNWYFSLFLHQNLVSFK